MLLFDGPRQHDDLACAARRQRKPSLRRAHAGQRPKHRAKPPDFDAQPRAMRFIGELRSECARDERVPRRRLPATLRPARGRARTTPDALRARPPCLRHARHDGTRPRRAPSTPATLRPPRAGGVAPRHAQSGAPRACSGRGMRFRPPPSAQGCRAWRAARSARASAARAAFVRRRRIAIPATTSSWAVLDAGGKGAGSSSASVRSASSRRPIRRRRRTSRYRACAAFTRSPCASSVARAASSAFAGQPRSRETSAISASATTHLARATASFGPKARAALSQERLRSNEIAELRHRDASKRERGRVVAQGDPLQCAEGITRRERTRRGRDQRVHRNPVTLVTPTVRCPALNLSHDRQPHDRIEN